MWTAALLTSMVFIALPTFALSAKHTEEEKKEWQCGTDDVTKFLTESQIEFDCPNLKKRINKCCVEHDDCYSEQAGRKYCDDEFCQCLTVATRGSEICARENGPLLCHIVRELGEEPYRLSAPNATLAAVQNATVSTGNAQTLARHINVDRSLVRRNGSVDELHNETSPIISLLTSQHM
ncbi:hypothetical protein KIN20_035946 [Parelaphostrongylus tenuis]|uniref:Uncharacterized protein n=1 Tax=Parelaphostrongylus tenuis TaxID=148309 RepID=A0AAD5RCB7_PARTN|nr:hypothetical protein KIN20_035946 [Parelaphostrongylus tenuis]